MKTPFTFTLRGVLCALVAVSIISVVQADETKKDKPVPAAAIKKYDANKDGVLDETEKAAWDADVAKRKADELAKRLEKYDTNKDGTIDEAELAAEKAAKKEMIEKKKAEAAKKKAEKEAAAAGATVPAPTE